MGIYDEMMPVRKAVLGMTLQSLTRRQFYQNVVAPPGAMNRYDASTGAGMMGAMPIDKGAHFWEPSNVSIAQNHVANGPPFNQSGMADRTVLKPEQMDQGGGAGSSS